MSDMTIRFGWSVEDSPELRGALAIDPVHEQAELRLAETLSALDLLLDELTPDVQPRAAAAATDLANATAALMTVRTATRMRQVVGGWQAYATDLQQRWEEWAASVEATREVPPINITLAIPESLRVALEQPARSFTIEKAD